MKQIPLTIYTSANWRYCSLDVGEVTHLLWTHGRGAQERRPNF